MPRETVIVTNRFRHLERELERGIERGLERGARSAEAAARAAQDVRGDLDIKATAAYRERSRSGKVLIAVSVIARDFKSNWFQFGTLAKRRRKTKRPRTPRAQAIAARGGGIRPRRFLTKGLAVGWPAVLRALQQELRSLR